MDIYISGRIKLIVLGAVFMISDNIDFKVDNKLFTIKKGMITDLGSIPVHLRNILPRFGLETNGYVLHDFGYRTQPVKTTRKYWDNVLFYQLKKDGIGYFKRYSIYWGLRLFGSKVWEENKKFKVTL